MSKSYNESNAKSKKIKVKTTLKKDSYEMKSKTKQILFYIAFGIVLFVGLIKISYVLQFLQNIIDLVSPILLGLLSAFILNVPMRGFEHLITRIFSKAKHKTTGKSLHIISLLLTLICILLIVTLACTLVIPTLITSVKSIYPLIKESRPKWMAYLQSQQIDVSRVTEWVSSLDIKQITGNVNNIFDSVVHAATSTISVISSEIFGTIIAIYILLNKSTLVPQVKKLIHANLKESHENRIYYISRLVRDTYAKFLSGQCVEAILFGVLIFVAFSIFRLPYAALIGFLTSLFAFVPYIGAFVSCFIGAFLILLVNPEKILLCVIVYVAVQFIENQFIYPHVVGSSVGLAPLWTLIAALVSGKMFGLPGIIFFIPLTAALYTIIRDDTNKKLKAKETAKEEISVIADQADGE